MIDTERKVRNLIKKLSEHENIKNLHPFEVKEDRFWKYYFNITGYFNGNYFAIIAAKPKYTNSISEFEISEDVTDNIEEFKKEFKL